MTNLPSVLSLALIRCKVLDTKRFIRVFRISKLFKYKQMISFFENQVSDIYLLENVVKLGFRAITTEICWSNEK